MGKHNTVKEVEEKCLTYYNRVTMCSENAQIALLIFYQWNCIWESVREVVGRAKALVLITESKQYSDLSKGNKCAAGKQTDQHLSEAVRSSRTSCSQCGFCFCLMKLTVLVVLFCFFIIAALVNCLLKRHLFLILDQLEVNQSDPLINLLFTAWAEWRKVKVSHP